MNITGRVRKHKKIKPSQGGAMRGSAWADASLVKSSLRPGEFFQCTRCGARFNDPARVRIVDLRRYHLEIGKKYPGKCTRCPARGFIFGYIPWSRKGVVPHQKGDMRLQYSTAQPWCKGCGMRRAKHYHKVGHRVQDIKYCCNDLACCRKIIKHPETTPMTLPSLFKNDLKWRSIPV
jgi:hypothetical protein